MVAGFAERLNALNAAAVLADSLAAEGVAAAAASAELDKSGASADGALLAPCCLLLAA